MIPRTPNTVTNVTALLVDGDLVGFLPTGDRDKPASREVGKNFGWLRVCIFRLGWRGLDVHPGKCTPVMCHQQNECPYRDSDYADKGLQMAYERCA